MFDSGSSDGTVKILKDYVGKIDFFIERSRAISCYKKGPEKARGDILGYLSDDTLLSDSIGRFGLWAEHPIQIYCMGSSLH